MAKEDNLSIIRDSETAKERQKLSAAKRSQNVKERKLISALYARLLDRTIDLEDGSKIDGDELLIQAFIKTLKRGGHSSILAAKEMREALEGQTLKHEITEEVNEKRKALLELIDGPAGNGQGGSEPTGVLEKDSKTKTADSQD